MRPPDIAFFILKTSLNLFFSFHYELFFTVLCCIPFSDVHKRIGWQTRHQVRFQEGDVWSENST